MARAIPYKDAIQWMVDNDDTEWAKEGEDAPSVTAVLIADIYGKTEDEVRSDLVKGLKKAGRMEEED